MYTFTMGLICNYIGTIVRQVLFVIQHASTLWYGYQIVLTDMFFVDSFDENLDQVCVCVNEVGKNCLFIIPSHLFSKADN
jgi:hypothetical protein